MGMKSTRTQIALIRFNFDPKQTLLRVKLS